MINTLQPLTKRLNKIIDREIREAEIEGLTIDVGTIFQRVQTSCSTFLYKLLSLFAERYLRILISHRLKHPKYKGKVNNQGSGSQSPQFEQPVFPGMEELRGYPARLTYEQDGRVIFVNSEIAHEFDCDEAEKYDDKIFDAHARSRQCLKTGNRFFRKLRKTYGDLANKDLIDKWEQDQQDRRTHDQQTS